MGWDKINQILSNHCQFIDSGSIIPDDSLKYLSKRSVTAIIQTKKSQ